MERNPTDKSIDDLADRVGRFEGRFERFEDKVDARFDKIDAHFGVWGKILGSGVVMIAAAVALKILGVDA